MRNLMFGVSGILLISTTNAFALTASLSVDGNGGTVLVPPGGGTYDVRINFLREGFDDDIYAAISGFVADKSGIIINPSAGGTTLSGTGTRYNQFEWDASTNSNALNPNTTLAGVMSPGIPRGSLGTVYAANNGVWSTGEDSFFGILNVTLAPEPNGYVIRLDTSDAQVITFGFDDPAASDGVTFQYIPEPASALLLLSALPFMRRHRTAQVQKFEIANDKDLKEAGSL